MKGRRPYAFEILIAVNLVVIGAEAPREVTGTILDSLRSVLPLSLGCVAVGIALRLLLGWRRGRLRRLTTIYRSPRWIADSLRLQLGLALLTHTYGWIKLLVPILHPRLYDRQLFDLDRALFGGNSPSVFLLTLFSDSRFLRFIDMTYANVFAATMLAATAYFLSDPRAKLRIAYMTSNAMLWLSGAWAYVLVPSLGPAYRFPQVWLEYAGQLRTTQAIQALLMQNYQNVLRLTRGIQAPVRVVYGVAAFPSLHVASQVFIALWMRREWAYGQLVFGLCAFFILVGSMVTGWHYFVDGVAGALLAIVSYVVCVHAYDVHRRVSSGR